MKRRIFATAFGFLVALAGGQARADILLSCSETETAPPILNYLLKSTPSRRLNSDVFYETAAGVTIYSTANVAHYKATDAELYLLVDDATEKPLLSFTGALSVKATANAPTNLKRPLVRPIAQPTGLPSTGTLPDGPFMGMLNELENGLVTKSITLRCTLTPF